jgi:heme-degrading monooxygenase HmoA
LGRSRQGRGLSGAFPRFGPAGAACNEGFLGATLTRQEENGRIEFLVMRRWASLDAIRAFAGDMLERAVVEPGAVAALESFDKTVSHYEVIENVEA